MTPPSRTASLEPVISAQAYRPRTSDTPTIRPPAPVDPEVLRSVEQFLYLEAQLLDEARYNDWFDLLADDLHYFMPTRRNRLHRDLLKESSVPGELAHYDDTRASLALRIRRVQQPTAWSDNPPPRTVRAISNITAEVTDHAAGEYRVRSVFQLHRNRLADDADSFAGRRVDTLRKDPEVGFRLADRTIHLAQSVVLAKNLGVFF